MQAKSQQGKTGPLRRGQATVGAVTTTEKIQVETDDGITRCGNSDYEAVKFFFPARGPGEIGEQSHSVHQFVQAQIMAQCSANHDPGRKACDTPGMIVD